MSMITLALKKSHQQQRQENEEEEEQIKMPLNYHFIDRETGEMVPLKVVNEKMRSLLDVRRAVQTDCDSDELELLTWVGIAYVMGMETALERGGKTKEEAELEASGRSFNLRTSNEYDNFRRDVFKYMLKTLYTFHAYRSEESCSF